MSLRLGLLTLVLLLPQESPDDLVRQLGSDDFDSRERAMDALYKLGAAALPAVEKALDSPDAEIRHRAKLLFPRLKYVLPRDTPDSVVDLVTRFEDCPDDEKVKIVAALAEIRHPVVRPVLLRLWKKLDSVDVLCALAPQFMRVNTLLVEERLHELAAKGSPKILEQLGDLLVLRGAFSPAADAYARATSLPGVPEKLARALDFAHRDAELVDLLKTDSVDRLEALYRVGRRAEADALAPRLGEEAAAVALRHGSPIAALAAKPASPAVVIRACLAIGDFAAAERAWREIPKEAERIPLLEEILTARGDFDLRGPMFISEVISGGDAVKHHAFAGDGDFGLVELKKACFLDPRPEWLEELAKACEKAGDPARAIDALKRLGPDAQDEIDRLSKGGIERRLAGAGFWDQPLAVARPDQLFASEPVRLGGFLYYATREGDLVKSKGLFDPPAWIYRPPKKRRVFSRGWQFEFYLRNPVVAEWKGSLVVLFDRGAHLHSGEGSGWDDGQLLCVLDPETGRERWTASFPGFSDGRIHAAQGVIGFASGGVALFDLETRAWRWGIGGLEEPLGSTEVVGDHLYAGFPSGSLYKVKLSDGSLAWKKAFFAQQAWRWHLESAEGELLFSPGGDRLIALSPDSGDVAWEASPRATGRWRIVDGVAYALGDCPAAAAAVSLADGKILWDRLLERNSDYGSHGIGPLGLWRVDSTRFWLLDPKTGDVRLAANNPAGRSWGSAWTLENGVLYHSQASIFSAAVKLNDPYNPDEPAGLTAWRIVLPRETAKRDLVDVTLLEDAVMARGDSASLLDYAGACDKAGHPEWGVRALSLGALLADDATRAKLKDRKELADLHLDPDAMPSGRSTDFLKHPDRAKRLKAGLQVAAENRFAAIPAIATSLDGADAKSCLQALGALAALWVVQQHENRRWGGYPRSTWPLVQERIRALLDHADPAVRGGAAALLRLQGLEAPGDALRDARDSDEPTVKAVAAWALGDGDTVAKSIVGDRWAVSAWLAGRMKLASAVEPLMLRFKDRASVVLEALSRIGGAAASEFVFARVADAGISDDEEFADFLGRLGTPKAVDALLTMVRNRGSHSLADAGARGLMRVDSSAARQGVLEFTTEELAAYPDNPFARVRSVRALIGEGRLKEAREGLDLLAVAWPPIAILLELRFRLLASEGRKDEAVAMRESALKASTLAASLEPANPRHRMQAGRLYLDPPDLADRAKARAHFEAALALDPGSEEIRALIKRATE